LQEGEQEEEEAEKEEESFLALARTLTIWDSSYATETEVVLQRPRVTDVAISAIAQHCPHINRLELCGLEALVRCIPTSPSLVSSAKVLPEHD